MNAPDQRIDRGTAVSLVAIALAVFVIANDFTALIVALPNIEHELDSSLTTVQWVINGYALVFGVLIVTGGRLADMFGRRRIFFVGAAIFATFSLVGGIAQSDAWLIAARALMGIGGALIWPAALGMTYAALPESKAGLAGGLILGTAGLGNAVGPLIGGVLTDEASWRWILLLNLPIALVAVLVIWRYVRQPRPDAARERIDYSGIATLSIGLVALLLALDEAPDAGFGDPLIIALLALAVAFLVVFVLIERRARSHALVPGDVMGNPNFRAACLAVLLISATFFAALFYLPQFMEKVLGHSALGAGVGLLPMMVVFGAISFAVGPLYERLGAKRVVSTGAACLALGLLLVSFSFGDRSYAMLVPGMVVVGLGVGIFYSAITTAGVTALDPSKASLAGGIVYMFQVAGGAVGLALTTTVFTSVSRAQDSFVAGVEVGFRLDAAFALASFLVALGFVGGRLRWGAAPVS